MKRSGGVGAMGAAVALCAAVLAACPDRAPRVGTAAPDASAAVAAARPSFLRKVGTSAPVTLDLSQPEQRAFLMEQLEGTAFTAAATPQLHKVIGAMGAPPSNARTLRQLQQPPDNRPVDLLDTFGAVAADGTATATGIASAVGRSTFIHAALRLVDADTGEPLGPPAFSSSFTGVETDLTTTAKVARPGQRVQAVLTAVYAPYACPPQAVDCHDRPGLAAAVPDGGMPFASALTAGLSGGAYAQVYVQPLAGAAASIISPAAPPQPLAPLSTGSAGTTICLGRMPGSQPNRCSPDGGPPCNYCDSSQGPTATPVLRLPVSGTVSLRYPAATPPAITAFSSYIVPVSTGGGCKQYNTVSPDGGFSSLSGGSVVRWYYGQSNYDLTSWVQYGQLASGAACWTATGEAINFQFAFTVQDTQGNSVPVVVADFGQPSANTAVIPQVKLAYGCLAAGTPVTMADGKAKPVERIEVGDLIRSDAAGTVRPVEMTYLGNEFLPLIRLTTANHKTVTVTEGHPVLGAGGQVTLAKRVAVGMVLLTAAGPSPVTQVERVPPPPGGSARVYNLDVGEARGGKPALTATNRTLFAGGILVGDNVMQREHGQAVQLAATEDGSLPVPPEWAAEYALARKLSASR